jgi:hypothetical protein
MSATRDQELFRAAEARAPLCRCGHNATRHIHEGAFPTEPRGKAPCFGEEFRGGCDCANFMEASAEPTP